MFTYAVRFSLHLQTIVMAAGAVSGAVSSALGSGSNEAEELASKVNNFVCEILPKLSKMAVTKRETKLCEAFCLLWHHRRLGTMEGRQTNNKLISCAYVGVILDLWATGKIEITVQEKSTNNTRYTNALIKVWNYGGFVNLQFNTHC